jgi:tetratricopeptide (TPR) repeat protein
MNKAKYTEWIDSYLEGELDAAGMESFETEMKVNRQLALEYQLEMDLVEVLHDEDILDFKAKCIEAHKEVNLMKRGTARVVHIARKYWYAAASVIIILLIAGGLYVLNPGGYSNERLFKMYYKSSEIGITRSGNVNMVEALIYFSRKDYQTAAQLFDKILSAEPGNMAVTYYSGITNIEIRNYAHAIDMFKAIIKDGNNLYVENAQWYLGLAYLIDEKNDDAIEQFRIIADNPGHYYNSQAVSILDKLNKNEKNKEILNNLFFLILPF